MSIPLIKNIRNTRLTTNSFVVLNFPKLNKETARRPKENIVINPHKIIDSILIPPLREGIMRDDKTVTIFS